MATTRANTNKDYAAIAASKIAKPSTVKQRLPMIHVYGRNKKGKTHFGTTAGRVLILDPESGTDSYTTVDPDVWKITRWEDFDDVYKFLRLGTHNYQYVDLDGMTRFANMALRFVMEQAEEHDISRKPGMVAQRDYGKSGELVKGLLYNFHNLGVGVIISSQERQIDGEFTEEDEDVEESTVQYVPDLPKGVRSTVNSLADIIGRVYTVQKEDGKIEYRMWLAPSAIYDTGYRSEYNLPQYLSNPTVPKLIKLIRTGKATTRKKEA